MRGTQMPNEKRYYWLKLKEDFFNQKYIKALRKLPDGDSLTIIYLKMQLLTLNHEGVLSFEHIMPNCESEIALATDEDENKVRFAIEALINMGIVERLDNDDLLLSSVSELVGSETLSAKRVRNHRKNKALQCNKNVTPDIDIDIDIDIDKDIDNNSLSSSDDDKRTAFDYKSVIDLFHRVCVSLPKVKKLTDSRKRSIRKAAKELEELDSSFESLFGCVEQSDFLTGRKGGKGFGFDWILTPKNLVKIIEGNYNNGNRSGSHYIPTEADYFEEW